MKKKALILSLSLCFSASVASADILPSIRAYVTPGGAAAMACNTAYMFPIQCAVQVRGFYPNGLFAYSIVNMLLAPGACDYAFVNAGYYPFAYADANAQCTFIQ